MTWAIALGWALALPVAAASVPGDEEPKLSIPAAARAQPGFDVDRATEAWLATLTAEQRAQSDAYFEGGYWIEAFGWILGLAIAAWLLGSGLARRGRDFARRRIRSRYLADAVAAGLFLAAMAVLEFPWTLWTDFFREHAYGLANQGFAAWLGDWAKGLAVTLVFMSPAIALIYVVVRRSPRNWWLWASVCSTALLAFGMTVAPVFIAPLFNKYQALPAGELRDEILTLAHANRVPATDVYWFDASRQSKRVSANVSGLLGTTRISLNDNLLRRSPRETVLAVLGHEMGHYVLNHVWELLLEISVVLLAGFACVRFAFDRTVARWGRRWGVEGLADTAGLPLATALFSTFLFVATPAVNTLIRANEAEADAFGVNAAQQPDGFAFAALQLAEYRKMRPGKLEEILFYDHPSGYDRIHRAMEWKAAHLDQCAEREARAGE
ncbi:MAG: M48 family metallopeptidase [Thermoanaerobaculia bacterium]